jgi:hypothetical protein
MNTSTNVIETHNLTKIYANKHIALNGAELTVPRGGVFGLGENYHHPAVVRAAKPNGGQRAGVW